MNMKDYTHFVRDVFTCITEDLGNPPKAIRFFAENDISAPNHEQDSAALWDGDAELFLSLWKKEAEKQGIGQDERSILSWRKYEDVILWGGQQKEILSSRLDNSKHGKHVMHSCYPKNLRRWLAGTVSRKKINRLDFCILAWCHTIEWRQLDHYVLEPHTGCQKRMLGICNEYAEVSEKVLSFDLLWDASTKAYFRSFSK